MVTNIPNTTHILVGGKTPVDKVTIVEKIKVVDAVALIVICTLSTIGSVVACFFLAFNLYNRSLK